MDERKIVYSTSGRKALDEAVNQYVRLLESEIRKNKYVPGEDLVEATARDVEEVSERTIVWPRKTRTRRISNMVLTVYGLAGALMLVGGVFYKWFRTLMEQSNTTQLMLIVGGGSLVFVSLVARVVIQTREGYQALPERVLERLLGEERKER